MFQFLYRQRRKLGVLSFGVAAISGGFYLAQQYIAKKSLEAEISQTKCIINRTRHRQQFESVLRTASRTLNESLYHALVQMLDSLDDALGDMSPKKLLTELKSITDPEKKIDLWSKLSIVVFTRCSTLILSASYLTALIHIQLSILAGYNYKQLAASEISNASTYYKKYNDPQDHMLLTKERDQEAYLSEATNAFMLNGVSQIQQFLLKDIVPNALNGFKLSQRLTLSDISDLFRSLIQRTLSTEFIGVVSAANDKEQVSQKYSAESPSDGGSLSSIENKDALNSLRYDTLDVLDCPDFVRVIKDCAEDCINLITDYLQFQLKASTGENNNHHEESTMKYAKLIPMINNLTNELEGKGKLEWDSENEYGIGVSPLFNTILHNKLMRSFSENIYESFSQS